MQATQTLASFAAETRTADLPGSVLAHGRRLLLDTVGVAIGATGLGPARLLVDAVLSWGGAPEASILPNGPRVPAAQAAYANAYLANLLDADETLLNYAHIANCIVPSALAVGQRVGASGRDLLAAVAIGYEVAARIGAAYRTWHLVDGKPEWSPVTGYSWAVFGVAAAAGRLLGLGRDAMASAFGIAGYSTPAPSIGKWVDSTRLPNTKYVFVGPLSQAGVTAACLAARGFLGDDDILDGDRGFWRISGSDACNWQMMTGDLGQRWLLDEVSYKRYPACRFLHGPLDLLAQLVAVEGLEPAEIDEVVVRLPPAALRPYFRNPEPADVVEGSFSVPHAVACVAHRLPPGPIWHVPETLRRADLAEFRDRVRIEVEPRATPVIVEQMVSGAGTSIYRRCPTSLRVTAGGRVFEASTDYASGDPWSAETHFSDRDLEEKFSTYTRGIMDAAAIDAALDAIRTIEDLADVQALPFLRSAPGT